MYAHSFLVTSVLGSGLGPTIAAKASLGFTGVINFEFAMIFSFCSRFN